MSYYTFFVTRQILMGILLILAVQMLFTKVPKLIVGSLYHKSLRMMGLAFIIVPLSCFIYTQQNKLDFEPYISTAINLSVYYATFLLMSVAFLMLLGRKFSRTLMVLMAAFIAIYPTPLWLAIFYGGEELVTTIISASYSFLVIIITLLVACILYNHRKVIRNLDNFYSNDTMICVSWMSKSITLLIGLSITCAVAPIFFTCTLWLRAIFMLYGVVCYVYIHYGYRRMLIHLSEHLTAQHQTIENFTEIERTTTTPTTLSPEISLSIEHKLTKWIENKKYLANDFTINDIAKDISTNRTYLSKYINSTYNCTFRAWITSLRIEESKNLLQYHPEISINKVALRSGFASIESFSHIFNRSEHISPSKWRKKYCVRETIQQKS